MVFLITQFLFAISETSVSQEGFFSQIFSVGMLPLWLCSLVLLTIIIERVRSLRQKYILDPTLTEEIKSLIREGKIKEAHDRAKKSETIIGQAYERGFEDFSLDGGGLRECLTSAAILSFKPLKRNIGIINTIGVISPLLGLLGTVVGMIITFSQIASSGGAGKAELAGGISLAMFTTAGGLIVAIPAIIAGRFFASKLESFAEIAEYDIEHIDAAFRAFKANQ